MMPIILLILAGLLTLTALSLVEIAHLETPMLNMQALLPMLALVWALSLLALAPARWQRWLAAPLKWLRRRIMALWGGILVYILGGLALLNLLYVEGLYTRSSSSTDRFILLLLVWLLVLILAFGLDREEGQALRYKLQTSRLTGVMISLTTLVFLFTAVDLGARWFLARSDGFGFTFMATNWLSRYWQPVNALGYRDYEIIDVPDTVQQILVTGDSFAAGYGVARLEAAFPHRLGAMLGVDYQVHVVALPGWAADQELAALSVYPVQPDILIVSHYIDDIRPTAQALGLKHPATPYPDPPLSWLLGGFQIPNYVYWHVYAPRTFLLPYKDAFRQFVEASYTTPEIWAAYEDKLMQFVEFARKSQAQLVVLVWSDMQDVANSAVFTQPVVDFFEANGGDVVDMTADLLTFEPAARVANPYDFHPSEAVHQVAADRLFAVLRP